MPDRPERRTVAPYVPPVGSAAKPIAPRRPEPAAGDQERSDAPPPRLSGTRRTALSVRLSPEERAKLTSLANRLGYTLGNAVRWLIANHRESRP